MAPLSNFTTTSAVSSRPLSRQSGSTSASAVAYTSTASAPGLRNRSASKSWIRVSLKIVFGATRDGSKPPGSRVTDRTSRGVPSVPSSSRARAARQSAAKRRLKPTCSTTPAARAASIARSTSASANPIGFSQNTPLPAVAAATTRSAWNRAGAAITTASTSGLANASAASVYAVSAPSCGREPLGRARRRVGHRGQPHARDPPGQRLAVEGAHPPRPDEGHPYVRHVVSSCLERYREGCITATCSSIERSSRVVAMDRRTTLADVAARAGVSTALVSIVMREAPGASAATRERVLAIADELGYRPDSRARLLRRSRSRLLGVVFGVQHAFHGDLVDGLYAAADRVGYELALSAVTPGRDEERAVGSLLQDRCEALVLLGPQAPAAYLAILAARLPVVVVARAVRHRAVDVVRTDDAAGLEQAVDHLVELGHRRIAHVDGGRAPGAAERRRGYTDALHRHDLGDTR